MQKKIPGEDPCWSAILIKLHAILLKSQFGMGALLKFATYFYNIFS